MYRRTFATIVTLTLCATSVVWAGNNHRPNSTARTHITPLGRTTSQLVHRNMTLPVGTELRLITGVYREGTVRNLEHYVGKAGGGGPWEFIGPWAELAEKVMKAQQKPRTVLQQALKQVNSGREARRREVRRMKPLIEEILASQRLDEALRLQGYQPVMPSVDGPSQLGDGIFVAGYHGRELRIVRADKTPRFLFEPASPSDFYLPFEGAPAAGREPFNRPAALQQGMWVTLDGKGARFREIPWQDVLRLMPNVGKQTLEMALEDWAALKRTGGGLFAS